MTRPAAALQSPVLRGGSRRPVLPPRIIGVVTLIITAAGWGFNWPVMKLLLRDWPPMFARGVGGVTASLVLAAIACACGQTLRVPRAAIPRLLFAAFTNVFAWMGFSTIAMMWVSVGEGALLVFTMPVWVTLLAWPLLGERPTIKGFSALVLGFAGVGVILGGQTVSLDGGEIVGIMLALGAAILFALGAVLNRKPLPLMPIALTAWQVGLGCMPMVVIGLVFEHPQYGALSHTGAWALAFMTVFSMGVCYLTWFATLRRLPAAAASTGLLLVPLIGITAAAVLLGEPLGTRQVVAMALTFAGVTLALRRG